ncbi:MAG: hypothetical protein RQ842_08160 [Vulcanisaeta sp.]|nr:hypothetical protein [Vulcanisaeta sp.]
MDGIKLLEELAQRPARLRLLVVLIKRGLLTSTEVWRLLKHDKHAKEALRFLVEAGLAECTNDAPKLCMPNREHFFVRAFAKFIEELGIGGGEYVGVGLEPLAREVVGDIEREWGKYVVNHDGTIKITPAVLRELAARHGRGNVHVGWLARLVAAMLKAEGHEVDIIRKPHNGFIMYAKKRYT